MEEFQVLYSKVILKRDIELDLNSMKEQDVRLEIDAAYKIGKSIAVLLNDQVIGHLTHWVAKPVWLHLRHGHKLNGTIYGKLSSGFENAIRFSSFTRSPELGIEIRFYYQDYLDGSLRVSGNSQAKLLLAYIIKHRLNSFPGVTLSNCPPELKHFIN